jgi:competence protein ComFC
MLNSLFQKKNICFICKNSTASFICSRCSDNMNFYQNLRGRCSFKNWDLHFTAPYHQGFKRLIWDLKFGKNTGLAKGMAYLMLEGYLKKIKILPDLIGYVPMGSIKEKQRGYNQSKILADELGKLINRKTENLIKRKDKLSLYKNKKTDRENLVRNTMTAKSGDVNKNILIIDDVYTTGATTRETIRALGVEGFKNVSFLIFARQEKQENLENWFS